MHQRRATVLSLLEPVFFTFVEQIRLCATKVHNFGAAIPILLALHAFFAIVCVRDALPATDDATTQVTAIVALVTRPDKGVRPHV